MHRHPLGQGVIIMSWIEKDDRLEKTFKFKDFRDAMAFMLRVSYECDSMDHHPKWTNTYNQVEVSLNTHDAGDKVTDKDRALAKTMDQIYQKYT